MLSRQEFDRAIEAFMGELSAILVARRDQELPANPSLRDEINEARTLMVDPTTTDAQLVSLSFGLVDEFVAAQRDRILEEAYAFYRDVSGGRANSR